MAEAELRPIPGRPLLELNPGRTGPGRSVVVADLHLGLGAGSVHPREEAAHLAAELLVVGRGLKAREFLFLGDVKHPIVGTPPPLRPVIFDFFSTLLSAGFQTSIILGNHDTGLVPHLPREVSVHSAGGIVRDGVGLFHGHRWPAPELHQASRLVVGHLHPGYRLAPTVDEAVGKLPCWVRTTYPKPPAPDRVPQAPRFAARELIVIPAFNPLCAMEALNRERPARGRSFLFRRFLAPGSSRAYLLDGTDLGPIVTRATPDLRRRPAERVTRDWSPGRGNVSRSKRAPARYRRRPGR